MSHLPPPFSPTGGGISVALKSRYNSEHERALQYDFPMYVGKVFATIFYDIISRRYMPEYARSCTGVVMSKVARM